MLSEKTYSIKIKKAYSIKSILSEKAWKLTGPDVRNRKEKE